jgi:hypothetical protein
MFLLTIQAYLQLIYFDFFVSSRNFAALYSKVRACPIASGASSGRGAASIVRAVDLACICYPKHVRCLQRSAATTCLMKNYGVPAQLIVGASQVPFRSHAWVEVDAQVVNDKPYVGEVYAVLDRC